MKGVIIFLILALTGISATGQNLFFEHIDEQDGLSQSQIQSIAGDSKGYIWFGTTDGLCRFDGNEIEPIGQKEDNPVLPGAVVSIHSGNFELAALTEKGLNLINLNSGEISVYPFYNGLRPVAVKKVLHAGNLILVGAESGLYVFDKTKLSYNKTAITTPVVDMAQLKPGVILISSVDGFHLFYPFNSTIKDISFFHSSYIRHSCTGENGLISWLEYDGVLYSGCIVGNQLKSVKSFPLPDVYLSSSLTSFRSKFYIGTNKGLLEIDSLNNTRWYFRESSDPFSLSQNDITCLLSDNQGKLWVGTGHGGVNLCNPYLHKFGLASPGRSSQFNQIREVIAFAENKDGTLLFSTLDGNIGVFDPSTEELNQLHEIKLTANAICELTEKPGKFFLGTPEGLFEYTPATRELVSVPTKNMVKPIESDIKSILPFHEDLYWMAGNDGLFLFDNRQKQTISYFSIGNSNLGSNNIRTIYKKSPDELYVGTSAGLYEFSISRGTFKLHKLNLKTTNQPFISQIISDKFKRIWIGTYKEGLYILQGDSPLTHLDTKNGFPDNGIYSILFSQDGNSGWISTNAGLSEIKVNGFGLKHFDANDGLQASEFIESSCLACRNGLLVFGGVAGFNYFFPEKLTEDTNSFSVDIRNLSVFNSRETYQPYYNIREEKNFLSFEFVSLDFNTKGSNRYFYQLENGGQSEWIDAGNRRFAGFGQLHAGEYVFRVRALNMDGYPSKNQATIHFTIIPPFYKTLWFRISLAVFLSALVAWLIYMRLRNLLKEEKEKTETNLMIGELELKALRAQMNPHFIFNSLNSIQDFVLNHEGQLAARYLSKFAKLIRMILDISEQTFVTIDQKLVFLKLYIELEALRLSNSFTFSIQVDPEINKEAQIPTLLIQPHVENAIWHGLQHKTGDRHLSITFSELNEDMIEVVVEDNGIGREAAMEIRKKRLGPHTSKGAKLSEDRIKVLNKLFGAEPKIEIIDLFDKNKVACGTKVVMQIPIRHG